jgi:acyl carrier protein
MSIEDKIRNFVQNYLYTADDRPLPDDASFLAEGIIDSMGAFELATFVEKEFGIKVEMPEIVVKNFDSVGQLARFVQRKLGTSVPAPMAAPPPTKPEVADR